MKKFMFIIALMMTNAIYAQNAGEENQVSDKTTFEKFTSSIGTIVKFKDYPLPEATGKTGGGMFAAVYTVNATVRQVIIEDVSSLFLKLSYKEYQGPERIAFIAYEDVVEIKKALDEIITQRQSDTTGEACYLENKFKTKDYLEIGYYISKETNRKGDNSFKSNYYIDLDTRYRSSTAFFSEPTALVELFNNAINKMNQLK